MSISAPDTQPVQAYPKQAEPMASFATSMQVVSLGNRPHALDRVVMTIAIAMLQWTNARIAREDTAHREHTWRLQQQESMSQREVQALRLTQRIGL